MTEHKKYSMYEMVSELEKQFSKADDAVEHEKQALTNWHGERTTEEYKARLDRYHVERNHRDNLRIAITVLRGSNL